MTAISPIAPALRAQPPSVPPHLQTTSTLESLVAHIVVPSSQKRAKITNWGGSFTVAPARVFAPTSIAECCIVLELARRQHKTVRAVGKAHSPSDLMMSDQWCLLMGGLEGILEVDAGPSPSATFLAGTFVSWINDRLAENSPPLAMSSLGSISEQTIGGLVSTATHGTGYDIPSVSAFVQHLDVVLPHPPELGGIRVQRCSRQENPDLFNATLCGLGATGLIVAVKVALEPAFRLAHIVEEVDFDWLFGQSTDHPALDVHSWDEEQTQSSEAVPSLQRTSIGRLVAAGQPLPALKERYRPSVRQPSAADIWPVAVSDEAALSRGEDDDEDDEITRQAQRHIDGIIQSSQHTRIWWFPQAGMCTVSRADRTLEPAAGPSWSSRLYSQIVGFHMEQALLFLARYHRSLPPRVAKAMHYLTHPSYPSQLHADRSGSPGQLEKPSSSVAATTEFEPTNVGAADAADSLASAYDGFSSKSTALSSLPSLESSTVSSQLRPLRGSNPYSINVDHSWRVFNMDCLFPQYTTEWSVPYTHTAAVIRTLRDWLDAEINENKSNVHFPIEIRWTDADGIWLSHGYGRKSCYIGLIQYRPYNLPVAYRKLFAKFETILRYFGGRPHWAKAHTCGVPELKQLYPHWDDWQEVRRKADPQGVLLNPYVRRHLLGQVGEDVNVRRFKRRQNGKL